MSHISPLSVYSSLKDKHIFITGVTGFLGKAILEKLLRDASQMKRVFVLIRGGRQSAERRFCEDVLGSSIFDTLRQEYGDEFENWAKSKISIIEGELTEPMFGLSSGEFAGLANQIDLIINSAASVNFRENLEKALEINTLSLNNIVALAQYNVQTQTPVMQVSTCYVNGLNQGTISETISAPKSGRIKALNDDSYAVEPLLNQLRNEIDRCKQRTQGPDKQEQALIKLGIQQSHYYGWNDTYTFTKWLGEQLLLQKLGRQKLTLLRPSIIESAIREPAPGWVEGVKVADALIYAYAKGRVSIFPGKNDGILDVIPVDLVANAALLAGAELLEMDDGYRIYQCCSGASNPIKLKTFIELVQESAIARYTEWPKLFASAPQEKFKTVSPGRFRLYMKGFTLLTWAKTAISRLFGSDKAGKLMLKAQTTASLANIFGFYTAPKYRFCSRKLEALQGQFSPIEQAKFEVRADSYDWQHYLQNIHLDGLHKYALADKPVLKAKPQARKQAA